MELVLTSLRFWQANPELMRWLRSLQDGGDYAKSDAANVPETQDLAGQLAITTACP